MSSVLEWVSEIFEDPFLTDRAESYLLSRGARSDWFEELKITSFEPPSSRCPDASLEETFGRNFEWFKGKTLFPFQDPFGRVFGWDSRTPGKKDPYKFVVPDQISPQWFGLTPEALDRIWYDKAPIYVVEGVFDYFAVRRVVTQGVVLAAGSAFLAQNQIKFLHRLGNEVTLILDNDPAGQKGAARATKMLSHLRVLTWGYQGKDPGEVWETRGDKGLSEEFGML